LRSPLRETVAKKKERGGRGSRDLTFPSKGKKQLNTQIKNSLKKKGRVSQLTALLLPPEGEVRPQ